ncbi:anthranilate phosphoribosyltransferase [Acidobacteria bacterium AH-259-A15]|nr:anthranilate phosphoribosyltransferase [Acidobacteria bacterium AH-259-A15]
MLKEFTRKLIEGHGLSETEAEESLELILSEETPDSAIASFLTALAIKGESSGEIAGFARVMRRQAVHVRANQSKLIDTAGTGGGADTFNISTAAAFVIAGAGVPVAKHGNRAMTSRCGSADVLEALGVRIENPPEVAERSLNEIGLAFMFAPIFHPAMKRVAQIRRELGHRTIFNLLGPLTNPASAPYQIIGVYSPDLTEKLAYALSALGCRRAWVVHSYDGLDELSIGSRVRVSDVKDLTVESFDLNPKDFGFEVSPASQFPGGTPEQNAKLIRSVLEGHSKGPARDVVVLNAAAALHVAAEGEFNEVIKKAEESLDSGAALDKLSQLVEACGG